ncbi:MAG: hypothetical protein M1480_20785 [Bacteroidetes bacterium]|nr:hypothetical protein [Bacteroidota bacterium]
MNGTDIIEEIKIELSNLEYIVMEIDSIKEEFKTVEPTVRDKTAAGSFLAQFYNGVENILKRISKLKDIELPKGELWHTELFKRFCEPPFENLPLIFDKELEMLVIPFRRFRHIVFHGYGFQLNWDLMISGIEQVNYVFEKFSAKVREFIDQETHS